MTNVGIRTQGARRRQLLARHWPRIALSLGVGGLMVWLLLGRLASIEPAEVAKAFAALSPQSWALAVAATLVSFWAAGSYDAVVHSHFATGLPAARSRLAGICAIAVSQMIGLGVVSGAVLRWRMLPEISLWQATRLTAAVALSFLAAWAVVTALVIAVLPDAPFKSVASAVLAGAALATLICLAAPRGLWPGMRWPNIFTLRRLLGLCVVDTLGAALAFYVLCPPETGIGFAILLPAFLLALGAGLVSGAPGGMGAFEMTLMALLPGVPEPDLVAAVLAWRIVYFALPAIAGAAMAIIGPRRRALRAVGVDPQHLADLVSRAPCAEVQIWRQGEHGLTGTPGKGLWLTARTSHALVALFAPVALDRRADKDSRGTAGRAALTLAIRHLAAAASAEGRMPVLYKAAPRTALAARAAGFHVMAISREASLPLHAYRTQTSSRAGLRRKLRRAEAAGICLMDPQMPTDWDALADISAEWARAHGGERGFSMGRYSRTYVAGQRRFVAALNGLPVAFVTVHAGPRQWVLDIMRHKTGVPDGTMHLLVQAAIDQAQAEGIAEFSLAAVPETAFDPVKGAPGRILSLLGGDSGIGLARFKSSFAPRWDRRYLCVPNRASLPLAAIEIARAVHAPPALPRSRGAVATAAPGDPQRAEYGFASAP